MITLQGRNICERQKELNLKVKEAAEKKVDLQEVKCIDNSDVDRIFKIDLASKYKNINYVLEELKSGDDLYVSRALKCMWLYDRDYASLINPDYLHHHIFPNMSLKMKKKMLSSICMHVRDETRAQLFYEYSMNTKMQSNALKFLIFTSASFKNELMNDDSRFFDLCNQVEIDYFKKFIGNSFTLADTYGKRERPIIELSYLYSLNEEEFLNLLEKHTKTPNHEKVVGVKMSRSILKKHKDRVVKKPLLYVNILNKSELIKYSSPEDAQVYAAALLPDHDYEFWGRNYCRTYKHILDLIKTPSMFEFVKKMFTEKYNSEFEMSEPFYKYKLYYDLMTFEEREAWALRHLQEQVDVIPEDENYKWYKFVTFAKSFKELKSKIYTATNLSRRSDMLTILAKSAKTQRDLEELLNYYYKRHVNEKREKKLGFIRTVMEHHKVLEFDDACWEAFDMLLQSLDIYNTSRYWGHDDTITVSLIYHVINNKTVPEDLRNYLKHGEYANYLKRYLDDLNDEKKDLVYNYMSQFVIGIISEFDSQEYSDAVKDEVRPYLKRCVELRRLFGKVEKYPEIVVKYMKLDLSNFEHIVGEPEKRKDEVQITEGYLIRCLKEDASLIVEKLPLIKDKFNDYNCCRINLLLRRIKIFFSNDIAKQCLDYFKKTLYDSLPDNAIAEYRAIFSIVFSIFQMGDEKIKGELMDKFAPTNPKIDHDKIGHYVLYTQEAICRFQSYSRPPVPLSKTALYLKGDYVHHCSSMFDKYLANLPPALRTDFIKLLIDAPLSAQKRGLRLAFKTYEPSELKDLVSNVWKKTKNVSMRQILYLLLLNKMVEDEGKTQEVLFELLKELTLTLHQDDADEVFACFSDYRIPANHRGSYLETAWKAVARLPEKKSNFQRKVRVIESIASNMSLMDEEFLVRLINDHVQKIICEQKLRPELFNDVELNAAMWDLTARYIVDIPNETKQEKSLKLVETITKECFNHWNEDYNTGDLIFQVFFRNFVDSLITNSSHCDTKYRNVVHIFEYLLESFEKQFGISEMYSYFWDWKLRLMMGKAVNGETSSDKEVCINFGLQLGFFIKELKDKNLCYISFFSKIVEKISCCMNDFDYENDPSLDVADVSVLVACGLTLTEMFETYLLALEILPINPTEILKTEYLEVIKKIKEQNNAELTAFMNDKFIYSDLKVRKFIM